MQEFGKQQELGQGRRGSTRLMPVEHKRLEEQYSWPSQHQKMLAEGKSDLGLSSILTSSLLTLTAGKISPLSFFSEHDTGNNNLVQQSD